jgi:hypothetical protein
MQQCPALQLFELIVDWRSATREREAGGGLARKAGSLLLKIGSD